MRRAQRSSRTELSTPITAQDPAVAVLCQLGLVSWLLGRPDRRDATHCGGQRPCRDARSTHQHGDDLPLRRRDTPVRGESEKAAEYARPGVSAAASTDTTIGAS